MTFPIQVSFSCECYGVNYCAQCDLSFSWLFLSSSLTLHDLQLSPLQQDTMLKPNHCDTFGCGQDVKSFFTGKS